MKAEQAGLTVLVLMAALASGCTRAQARVAAEPPALEVPEAPARLLPAMNAEVQQPVGAPESVPSGLAELTRPSSPSAPATSAPRAEVKPPETKVEPVEPARPSEAPRAQVASPLQSAPARREGEVEAAIRADLKRATDTLNRVDYRLLGVDAREQYNTAKTLILLADEAVRAKNLPFAKNIAEKAVTLSAQLASR